MPLKARSVTTSSRSFTSRHSDPADTPIQFVKGVGPRLGTIFQSRGVSTIKDLLFFFPRAYEDRSRLLSVSELVDGESGTISVRVLGSRKIPTRAGRSLLEVRCTDDTGVVNLKWFHAPRGMEARFRPGTRIIVSGSVKTFLGRPEMVHPEITWGAAEAAEPGQENPGLPNVGRVVPIYTEIEGVSSRTLRKILWEALDEFLPSLSEDLPAALLDRHRLPGLGQAIREIHFPPDHAVKLIEFNTPAHHRLIYEEFFKFEYLVLRQRLRMERRIARSFGREGGLEAARALARLLPFQLTQGQGKAIQEILHDLGQAHPMNRLIQGDVGSGKTVVAFITASCVLAEGGQAALMAPTEILAEQHFRSATTLFSGKLNVALLTGKTPLSERGPLMTRLSKGEPLLLIGTHALLEESVELPKLAYIMIDEQQRFGVEQRRALRRKGTRDDPGTSDSTHPHTLILSATPIPRTLALTAYGDLTVTSIRELPPGRTPILTRVVREKAQLDRAYDRIRSELEVGHQAYFIYPLVNESQAEGFAELKSAVTEAERLQREAFPRFKVGLLHGQQKPDEKARIMERFESGELHVLVSTTVVEVGVDVPNATVMVIEHAERFGLSQLHQLRGRVGRGARQSYCFLFSRPRTGETSRSRLEVLEQSDDGFRISEADLEIRGPGEFLGTRQAGGLPFRLAHLTRDRDWLLKARDDVMELLREDPDLVKPENLQLRRYFEREGHQQFERLKTS